jgi:hypothetical protein
MKGETGFKNDKNKFFFAPLVSLVLLFITN